MRARDARRPGPPPPPCRLPRAPRRSTGAARRNERRLGAFGRSPAARSPPRRSCWPATFEPGVSGRTARARGGSSVCSRAASSCAPLRRARRISLRMPLVSAASSVTRVAGTARMASGSSVRRTATMSPTGCICIQPEGRRCRRRCRARRHTSRCRVAPGPGLRTAVRAVPRATPGVKPSAAPRGFAPKAAAARGRTTGVDLLCDARRGRVRQRKRVER